MTDRNIYKKIKNIAVFFAIGLCVAGLFLFFQYKEEKNRLTLEAHNMLLEISEEKTKKIENYLSEMKNDLEILQKSDEVKKLLKKNLTFEKAIIEKDVKEKSRIITKEVENYLKMHPKMSLEDLQESSEFQKIAVQPVGKDGYSAIYDINDFAIYFHKYSSIIGVNIEKYFPELIGYIEEVKKTKEANQGFYRWKELSKKVRKKYGKFIPLSVKTADDFELGISVTAYVDDYKKIKEKSEYLENFSKKKDYHNILLISKDGYVSYMTDEHGPFGENLGWEVNLGHGLSKNYFDVKKSKEISFYGPFIGSYGYIFPKFSIMAPIYNKDKFLGYVAIVNQMKKIFEIVAEDKDSFSETKESYLVNKSLLLISPLRLENFDIMIQVIESENTERCFGMSESKKRIGHDPTGEFLNYKGDEVVGIHEIILDPSWCLITEIEKKEAIDDPLKKFLKGKIIISLIGVLVITVLGMFVGVFFNKKIRKTKIKKYPKTKKFLANLKLRYYFLFALVFTTSYFFLSMPFGEAKISTIFYNNISILLTTVILFVLFGYGFKLKKRASRNFVIIGSIFLIIDRLVWFFLGVYIFVHGAILDVYWVPGVVTGLVGLVFVFLGFKNALK